jgi:hypothetical protein
VVERLHGREWIAVTTSLRRERRNPSGYNRRIAVAAIVSVLLHTPLFLMPGAWRAGTLNDTTSAALHVRLVSPAPAQPVEREQRHHEPLPAEPIDVPEPIEPAPEVIEEVAVADTTTPVEEPGTPESAVPADPAVAEAGANQVPDELTQIEPEPPDTPAIPAEPVVATVAPAQEKVLTRRLVREARALLESRVPERRVTFEDEDRRFDAVLARQPASDGMGLERVVVEITTRHGGERVQTRLQMKRLAFSHFTQLVDHWDPWVQLHDDEIAGRFHSNSEIVLTYDRKIAPRLLGRVTTARRIRITGEEGWRSPRKIFAGGLETRTARIRLPAISLPVAHEYATRNADVQVVRSDTLIVFHANGDYDRIDVASRAEARGHLPRGRLTYIVGVRDSELRVRGVVNGNVTVYSPRRILVQGALTYAHAPDTGDETDDYLGLVSDGNVEIDRANVTGPGDLHVHAAIYARDRFVVRNVRARPAGTLVIYGSLTAGSLSETEPRYATRIEFDPRFERVRPPGFPETDRYEVESWDGRWRLAEAPSARE